MSRRKGVRQGPKGQHLSLFGRYITLLCQALQTDQSEIASIAGLSQSTVSKATKKLSPDEDTVTRIWQALVAIAERRGSELLLDTVLEQSVVNAAHCATEQQIAASERHLQSLSLLLESEKDRS